jgi:hypothetical protein
MPLGKQSASTLRGRKHRRFVTYQSIEYRGGARQGRSCLAPTPWASPIVEKPKRGSPLCCIARASQPHSTIAPVPTSSSIRPAPPHRLTLPAPARTRLETRPVHAPITFGQALSILYPLQRANFAQGQEIRKCLDHLVKRSTRKEFDEAAVPDGLPPRPECW